MTADIFQNAVERARKAKPSARKPPAKPKAQPAPAGPPAHLLERDEQRRLFAWAKYGSVTTPELHDLFCVPNSGGFTGGYLANKRRVMAMRLEGHRAGVPDIILPHARGRYHSLYIELKRVGATTSAVSARQKDWHERLRAGGNLVHVCHGWQAARDVLLGYLSLPRTNQKP